VAKMVTIEGTWRRSNTSRSEVYEYRRSLRRRFQRLGGCIDFTLPQKQKDAPGHSPWTGGNAGPKSGTFKLTLPLHNNYKTHRQNAKAALSLARAIIDLEVCRSATLKLDHSKTTTRHDIDVVGLI